MTVKEHIKGSLAELERTGKINRYIHMLLLTRFDSLVQSVSVCGSVGEAVKCELCGLGMEPGYPEYGTMMTPLTREEALTVFDQGSATVFVVCADGTEYELDSREEIARGDYCFAIENGHTITFHPEMELRL